MVFDTVVEDLPAETFGDRPWGPGDSPKTAVHAYLGLLADEGRSGIDGAPLAFTIDHKIDRKLLISVAPEDSSGGKDLGAEPAGLGTPESGGQRG